MIHYIEGNLFDSKAEALVNTVNTVGIMGKGIALQFKNLFPLNYKIYAKACKEKNLVVGKLLVTEDTSLLYGKKIIINFPTKTDWRQPSEYNYIDKGLQALVKLIEENKIKSIALPPLGSGNGGLEWNKVKPIIEKYLKVVDCDVYLYQPNFVIKEALKKERVSLTPARAMLLAVLYDFVRNGEFISEFVCEKTAYFLQRFGAKEVFNLDYQPNFYGPYSGKVKHVLFYLNGSYIAGFSSKDKKPFDELELIMDAEKDVIKYLNDLKNESYLEIILRTKEFLKGFYSSFGLELLSTIDFITQKFNNKDLNFVISELDIWSDRKRTLFSNQKYIEIALKRIEQINPM